MDDNPKGAGKNCGTTPIRDASQEEDNYPAGRAKDKGTAQAGLDNITTRVGRDGTNTVITKSDSM